MIKSVSPSFGSKLVLGDGTDFKLTQIARRKNLRSYEEGVKYVNDMVDKYQQKFDQIKDDSTITIETVTSNNPNCIFDFEFVPSKTLYEDKNGKLTPYIPRLPFRDKIKHDPSNPDYVRGLTKGIEYPSVEHVLRKAYELALDVNDSTNFIFIPPVPTLYK